ncbi:ABC transporter permease [Jeotgalibacillus aurantiacus]|uniref:ABC transporter permease n=1 Tax=Jeotgalibacillus aurantiacus TaxID=2763266 RepID=UPI001D0B19F2|nr:ABC transporter permease [Jeotgalibacillus aurantiacus]
MNKQSFSGTGQLIRFYLKADRIRIAAWILSLMALTSVTAWSLDGLYSSDAERQAMATTMENPAMTAMVGPAYGIENYHTGAMTAHQMLLFTAILVAVMAILHVSRHTRGDEEDGKMEMLGSLPVGRLASLTASMSVMVMSQVILALGIAVSLAVLSIPSLPVSSSILYGAALGATGIFFGTLTAVFAQLADSARGTTGLAFLVLGAAYMIRAAGDVNNDTLSWFSPLGWPLKTQVFVDDTWVPLIPLLAGAVVLTLIAFSVMASRDIGTGLIPSRPGRNHARKALLSPFGLTMHLQKTSIITWGVALLAIGLSYGSVIGDLETFFSSSELLSGAVDQSSGFSLTEQFISMLMSIMSMIAAVPALLFLFKLKGEEKKGRTETVYARAVSRYALFGSYFLVALIFGTVMMLLAIFGLWSAAAATMEDPISFGSLAKAGLVYVPAIWVMIGFGALLFGFKPGLTGLAWVYLGYAFFAVYLGGLLQFPEWVNRLSPFGFIPEVPMEEINVLTLVLLVLTAGLLAAVGFTTYRNRDLAG